MRGFEVGRLPLEQKRSQLVVNSIEIEDQSERGRQAGERPEQTSNVAEVVEDVVDAARDEQAIQVELEEHAAREQINFVVHVGRRPDLALLRRKNVLIFLEEQADGEE